MTTVSTSKGPLWETAATATDYWNDSCSIEELTYAIERGAVGATSNPTIVGEVLAKEMHLWRDRIGEIVAANPTWTEDEVAWQLIEEMAVRGAELLLPVFEREGGRKGRLSIQTNPKLYRDAARLIEQALRFAEAGAQHAGQDPRHARRDRGDRGGDRSRRGDQRDGLLHGSAGARGGRGGRARARAPRGGRRRTSTMSPVCTIMVGRLDDWMQALVGRDGARRRPRASCHGPESRAIKRAYGIYGERGYRTRLLAAAYRHHLHWSELIGGDVVLTIPHAWQRLFNASEHRSRGRGSTARPGDDRRRALPAFPRLPPRLRCRRAEPDEFDQLRRRPCARCAVPRLLHGSPGGGPRSDAAQPGSEVNGHTSSDRR